MKFIIVAPICIKILSFGDSINMKVLVWFV